MTTLNFKKIRELNLTPNDIVFLQACHQNTGHLDDYIMSFVGKDLSITPNLLVRLKSGSIRLSKEGRDLVREIFSPDVIAVDDSIISDYLIDLYKQDETKIVCSKDKLVKLVAWIRGLLGLDGRQLMHLLRLYFDSDESQYNKRLDYLIYKPNSAYGNIISLTNGESRIYNFYMSNKEEFDNTLRQI